MEKLTQKQQQVYDFIKEEIKTKGIPPSIREICSATGLSSTSSVHLHLATLEKKEKCCIVRCEQKGVLFGEEIPGSIPERSGSGSYRKSTVTKTSSIYHERKSQYRFTNRHSCIADRRDPFRSPHRRRNRTQIPYPPGTGGIVRRDPDRTVPSGEAPSGAART